MISWVPLSFDLMYRKGNSWDFVPSLRNFLLHMFNFSFNSKINLSFVIGMSLGELSALQLAFGTIVLFGILSTTPTATLVESRTANVTSKERGILFHSCAVAAGTLQLYLAAKMPRVTP
jgi:hypothetical protein